MEAQTPQIGSSFIDVLREREAQAAEFGARHLVAVPDPDSMLYWLAEVAREARIAAGRKQVHIAASTKRGVDQSTINRFEKRAGGWPRNPDATIEAYAEDIDDVSAIELWRAALERWETYATMPSDERAAWIARREAERTPSPRPAGRRARNGARRDTTGR